MRTTFRRGMHPAFDTAIPVSFLAGVIQRMMGITDAAPPVIGAVFGFFDDLTAIEAVQPTAVTAFVETERSFAVFAASPTVRARFG